MHTVR